MNDLFHLKIYCLEFVARATTPIEMGEYKGSALRGAWQSYLQASFCGVPPSMRSDPIHQQACPVCYLTSRETNSETRRPYALRPPLSRQACYQSGEKFVFGFQLFGNTQAIFPYVLLAAREMGRDRGIGRNPQTAKQRGYFELLEVNNLVPFTNQRIPVLKNGDSTIHPPSLAVEPQLISQICEQWLPDLNNGRTLKIDLLTPLRLINKEHLMRVFDPLVFFQRLLERLADLSEQYGDPPFSEKKSTLGDLVNGLSPMAQNIRLVQDNTYWWDISGYSNRLGRSQPLGGLVGSVHLAADDWSELLPIFLWGEIVQLGKNIVKGGGWYHLEVI